MTPSGPAVLMPTLTRAGSASTSAERSVPGVIPDDDPGPPAGVGINRQEARSVVRGRWRSRAFRAEQTPLYEGDAMCHHQPSCPVATATDHAAARVIGRQDNLGWSLLCNGVVVFDDAGELLPDGTPIAPRRWAAPGDRRLLRAA
jgi:Family of unknown function (DUF5999)